MARNNKVEMPRTIVVTKALHLLADALLLTRTLARASDFVIVACNCIAYCGMVDTPQELAELHTKRAVGGVCAL